MNAAIDKLVTEVRGLDEDIYQAEKRLSIFKNCVANMEGKRQELMDKYAAVRQETWDTGQEICPTCGQNLPKEKVDALRADFNRQKSEKLMSINQLGKATCSQARIDAAKEEIADLAESLEKRRKECADAHQRLQNLKSTVVKQPPFETTEEYATLAKRIEELRGKEKQGAKSEAEKTATSKISDVKAAIADVTSEIANFGHIQESKKRVEELNAELKSIAKQLEHLEHGINLCDEFTRTKARMVTESVNKHFSRVRFILFRDQINGGLKEVCEPTGQNRDGQWVEYRSLNYADKINAKLDIVNTLNRHYGVNLPVIMDHGESVTNPMPIDGQFIRLIVSAEDKDFRIEHK